MRLKLVAWSVVVSACGAPRSAPTTSPSPSSSPAFGVLVMAHGGDPAWNTAVEQEVAAVGAKHPVEIAFGMADAATLQSAVEKLEAKQVRRIGVVRLFISGESFVERTEQILGLKPGAPPRDAAAAHDQHAAHDKHANHDSHAAPAAPGGEHGHSMAFFRVTSAATFELSQDGLIDADGMGAVLADRARALSKDPAHEDVIVIAHGPGDDAENARWLAKLEQRASAIKTAAPFRRVHVETLREDWPAKRAEAEQRIRAFVTRAQAEGGRAIVVPFRVQGFGPYAKVLADLTYVSDGKGLIPHPEVSAWIDKQVEALAARPFRR
jgi:sirohydrochlorin cobaltochelatase